MRLVYDKEAAKAVWMDETEATRGLLQGSHYPVHEDEYLIVDPETSYVSPVQPKDLITYLRQGWRLADERESLRYEHKDDSVSAALLGAGDLIAGGAIHPLTQLTDELELTHEWAPRVRAIREQNPGAHVAGMVAGLAASLPATTVRALQGQQGMNAVRQAYSNAMLFPRGAAAAGELAALKAGQAARQMGAGRLAQRTVEMGARGAAEGAYYGFAHGMSEADMGDPQDVAENLIASTGMGTLMGGGFGAALPVVGAGISKVVKGTGRGAAALYGSAAGSTPAKGLAGGIERAMGAMQRRFHPEKAHLMDALENKVLRDEIADPNLVEGFAKRMAADVNVGVGALDDAIDFMYRGKYANAERLIRPANKAIAVSASGDAMQRIAQAADRFNMRGVDPSRVDDILYDFGRVQALSDKLQRIMTNVGRNLGAGPKATPVSSFKAIAQARRDVDDLIDWKAIRAGASRTREQRGVDDVLINLRKDLAKMLESEVSWGAQVAQQQRLLNQLYAKHKEGLPMFRQQLMAKVGKNNYVPDPAKIRRYLDDPQAGGNMRRDLAFNEFLAEQREAAKIIRDFYSGGGRWAGMLEHSAGKMEKLFGDVEGKLKLRNQVADWMKSAQQGVLSQAMHRGIAPVLVGGFAGGPVGAAAGLAFREGAEAMLNPARYHINLANLNRLKLAAQAHIKDRVKAGVTRKLPKNRLVPQLRRALTPSALRVLNTRGPERQRAVEAKVAEYNQYSDSPEGVRERVAAHLGMGAEVAPLIANAIAMRLVSVSSYMVSVSPKSEAPTLFGDAPQLSDAEIDKFARQMEVAEDPLVVLDRMYEGKLTLDESRALRAMYPELYRGMQDALLSYIEETGISEIPFARRMQVGILFDMPTDPSLLPGNMVVYQQSAKAMGSVAEPQRQPPKQPSTMRKLPVSTVKNLVSSNQTDMQRLESR